MGRILDTIGFWVSLFFKILPYVVAAYLLYLLAVGFNKGLQAQKKGFDLFLFACKDVVISLVSHLKTFFKAIFFVLVKLGEQQIKVEKEGKEEVKAKKLDEKHEVN